MGGAALLDAELRYVADDGVAVVTTLGEVDEAGRGRAGTAPARSRWSAALLRAVRVGDHAYPRGVREPFGA